MHFSLLAVNEIALLLQLKQIENGVRSALPWLWGVTDLIFYRSLFSSLLLHYRIRKKKIIMALNSIKNELVNQQIKNSV